MVEIDFAGLEKKWQDRWEAEKVFGVSEKGKNPYYVLEMFPYPSGSGLHMGHAWNYTIGDIMARFKRMSGMNVLYPMGYDSFGLPAENAATLAGEHPDDYTNKTIPNFMRQMKEIGLSYDWSRTFSTHEPSYYKWDQWIFLKMLEKGLAYQKTSAVNWCSKCNTVLANEQVHEGKCWRHDDCEVEVRHLKQWFLKTTEYADELYENLDKMDWPDKTKAMQRNWIGKSHGTEIDFEISKGGGKISNVVIVHGCPDSNEPRDPEKRSYEKHWRLWLKDNLEKENIKVDAPLMPEPWAPDYKKWKKEFDKLDINENSILVGHSCGCAFLGRWLGDTKQKIKKLILVAPWKIPYREDGSDKDFYDYKIDKCVKENIDEAVIFTSDNEEDDGKKSVKLFEKDIGGKIIDLKNHGHFVFGSMGTHEFPELLNEINRVKEQVLILHGWEDTSKSGFIPWLKDKLENDGKEVFDFDFPDTNSPDFDEWMNFAEKKIKKNGLKNFSIVGHSMGGHLALKLAEKYNVDKLVLVSPVGFNPSDKYFSQFKNSLPKEELEIFKKYQSHGLDVDKVKNNARKIDFIFGADDPYINGEVVDFFKENFENVEILKGKKHMSDSEGVKKLEEVLEFFKKDKWPIFTTRPDTIFGVTFMVVSAQHANLDSLVTKGQREEVDKFLKKLKSVSEKDAGDLEKEGVFTGSYAVNPVNGRRVPVWAGNFVVADYGAGMVMAVPAHDARDFEFAKKYGIEVRQVVRPVYGEAHKDAVYRDTISVVVHRKSDDKFLLVKWKEFGWIAPVVGGVDEGESVEDAAVREALEETGYKTKFVRTLGEKVESYFYADNKKVWRARVDQPVLLELIDEKPVEVEEKEKNRHDAIWLGADEALEQMTHKDNCAGLLEYLGKSEAYVGGGKLCNSGEFDGVDNVEAKKKITSWLKKKGVGRDVVNFKLRDWGVSRQRYWGTPIPVIYCEKCGVVGVAEKDLPIELPKDVKFGDGNPLETNEKWLNVKCPKCGGKGRRESDTMDTFVNSSWYFLRYCDPGNDKAIFDPKKVKYWCPVDTYVGGAEHACMHLIYSRFYVKFLRDLGLIDFDEPAVRLFHQGMLHGEDGEKMSKSKGNGVLPEEVSSKYGIDTARFFLSSLASPDKNIDWSEKGINGSSRFVKKIFEFSDKITFGKDSKGLEIRINNVVKMVTGYYDNFEYRKATILIRALFGLIEAEKIVSKETYEKFLQLLSPICPHIAEELWEKIGNKGFISKSSWPKVDEKKILKKGEAGDFNGKVIENVKGILDKTEGDVEKVCIYVMPFEIGKIDEKKISKGVGKEVEVYAVNDAGKRDPENRAKKAKPGKPSVWLE